MRGKHMIVNLGSYSCIWKKKWILLSIVFISHVIASGAWATDTTKELQKEFGLLTPDQAQVMAGECDNMSSKINSGLQKLHSGLSDIVTANKEYHKYRELRENTLKKWQKTYKAFEKPLTQWQSLELTCQEEFDITERERMIKRLNLNRFEWWHGKSPLETFEYWKKNVEPHQDASIRRDIPACVKADQFYHKEVVPTWKESFEAETEFKVMDKEFKEAKKKYDDSYSDYFDIFLFDILGPCIDYRKYDQRPYNEVRGLWDQLPTKYDLFSSEKVYHFLNKVRDVEVKVEGLCTRLRAWVEESSKKKPEEKSSVEEKKEKEKQEKDIDKARKHTVIYY